MLQIIFSHLRSSVVSHAARSTDSSHIPVSHIMAHGHAIASLLLQVIFPYSPAVLLQSAHHFLQSNAAGYTALHVAAAASANECVAFLLNNGALVDAIDIFGNTALHIVIAAGDSTDTVLRLLTARADPNLCNTDGNSALHIAAQHNRSKCVEQLLQHGGDPSILNIYGLSACAVALRMSAAFSHHCYILLRAFALCMTPSLGRALVAYRCCSAPYQPPLQRLTPHRFPKAHARCSRGASVQTGDWGTGLRSRCKTQRTRS